MNTFGEFDIDGFGDIGMLIFFLATFINLIILLNLVVAIVCEVFNEYNAMRLKSFYYQRAQLISDVWSTFWLTRDDEEA